MSLQPYQVKRAFADVASAQTDTVVVAAVAKKRIRVIGIFATALTAAATTLRLNSKPAGAGTQIASIISLPANGPFTLPPNQNDGWLETNTGEGLSVTTGAGAGVGVTVIYAELDN